MNSLIDRFRRKPRAKENPAETLREIAGELEADLASAEIKIAESAKRVTEIEERAMAAIRRGDNFAAHAAMTELTGTTTEIASLGADAHVLRSLLAEIREFQNS